MMPMNRNSDDAASTSAAVSTGTHSGKPALTATAP
jgi:hypothetical protein